MASTRYSLTVTRNRAETDEYVSIFLTKPDNFLYMPGGVFDLSFPNNTDKRIFSFASSPTEKEIMISYRKGTSDFKKQLENIAIGDFLHIDYFGSTLSLPKQKKMLFIAGGIGIAPFRSMIKYLIDTNSFEDCILIYINKNDFFAYAKELEAWKKQYPLRILYIQTARNGRLSKEKLVDFTQEVIQGERFTYISGPPSMVDATVHLLENLGVDRDIIKTDSFDGYNEEFKIG